MIECIMRRIECPMMNFRNIDDLLFVNVGCIDHVVYVHLVKQARVSRELLTRVAASHVIAKAIFG